MDRNKKWRYIAVPMFSLSLLIFGTTDLSARGWGIGPNYTGYLSMGSLGYLGSVLYRPDSENGNDGISKNFPLDLKPGDRKLLEFRNLIGVGGFMTLGKNHLTLSNMGIGFSNPTAGNAVPSHKTSFWFAADYAYRILNLEVFNFYVLGGTHANLSISNVKDTEWLTLSFSALVRTGAGISFRGIDVLEPYIHFQVGTGLRADIISNSDVSSRSVGMLSFPIVMFPEIGIRLWLWGN